MLDYGAGDYVWSVHEGARGLPPEKRVPAMRAGGGSWAWGSKLMREPGYDAAQTAPRLLAAVGTADGLDGVVTPRMEVDVAGQLFPKKGEGPIELGTTTLRFAVGVNPEPKPGDLVLKVGHHDVGIDADSGKLAVHGDSVRDPKGIDPKKVIVSVPPKTLQQIPPTPDFRFLGRPGTETYLLPQAVLGKHVHGEVDPHLWHSGPNAIAMVQAIRDKLISVDPPGAQTYQDNADAYIDEIKRVDVEMRDAVSRVPKEHRNLVTAHDGYSYLAKTYGLDVAGFVTPNPAVEPSTRDMVALTSTLRNLQVPAVFVEPSLAGRAKDLREVAHNNHIQVCTIRGDNFDPKVTTYLQLMHVNAETIQRCLAQPAPAKN